MSTRLAPRSGDSHKGVSRKGKRRRGGSTATRSIDTRNAAYYHVYAEELLSAERTHGRMGDRQRRVYEVILGNDDVTNSEIAAVLGWGINRVTGRTKELREKGLVVPGPRRACHITGLLVQAWQVASIQQVAP